MPIYEYTCTNEPCAYRTEKMVSLKDRTDTIECPHCGAEATLSPSTTGAPQFNGTGFHKTDYN